MNKVFTLIAVCFPLLLMVSPMFAQQPTEAPTATPAEGSAAVATHSPTGAPQFPMNIGALGAGLVTIGAAYGIGRLAGSALDSMARQPEVAGNIQTAMIIAAALIEGFTFYALYICQASLSKLPEITP